MRNGVTAGSYIIQRLIVICSLCSYGNTTEYLNLATDYRKSVNQSSTYKHATADKAVDGNTDQAMNHGSCSHTAAEKYSNVWWRLEFEEKVYIHEIVIYHRNDNVDVLDRFLNSIVYISDVADCSGHVVHRQTSRPSNLWQDVLHILPDAAGTFLSVCIKRGNVEVFLQLCEVIVKGCPYGRYGDQCSLTCGNCNMSNCDLDNGTCFGGCESHYMGASCNTSCDDRCKESLCTKQGCDGCVDGKHGTYCDQPCPTNCNNSICDQGEGLCSGCYNNTFWGETCADSCPTNCHDKTCVQENGVCIGSCKNDYWGSRCNETCPRGCKNKCNKQDGICMDGCIFTKWGDRCNKECPNCNSCNQSTGVCDSECVSNYWGNYCNETCSANCYGSSCTKDTGACEGGCIEGYAGHNCTEKMSPANENTGTVGAAVASVVVVVAIVISVLVGLAVRRRYVRLQEERSLSTTSHKLGECVDNPKRKRPGNEQSSVGQHSESTESGMPIVGQPGDEETEMSNIYVNSHQDNEDDSQYYNTCISKPARGILIDDLKDCMKSESKDNFKSCFSKMLYGPQFACNAGKLVENSSKNRFLEVLPYDHSRVKLHYSTTHTSDYINANYIDSFDSSQVYIAAQGPKKNTIEDTWRMIVQEKCGKIIMLTNLIDGMKKKCERYWPLADEKMELSNVTLTLVSEDIRLFYIVRTIHVSVQQNNETVTTLVTQFHFTTWPDHGVADPVQLAVFHRHVVETKTTLAGPLLVHCSAGVGRTGTFIALDALITYGKCNKRVDILGYVEKMRRNRMNMIQTNEQFQLLHESLFEALMYPGSAADSKHVMQSFDQILRRVNKEYQILKTMLPEYRCEAYSDAMRSANIDKNRDQSILPNNYHRPFLDYMPGRTDYINAVIVPGNIKNNAFLVTQLPLASTVVDFWRLVYDHESNVVVLLTPLDTDEEYPIMLPSEDIMRVGRYEISLMSVNRTNNNITESVFRISQQDYEDVREVNVLLTPSWNVNDELPPSKELILDLVESVNNWQKEKGDKPITVQCQNGATCSGLYCAVSKVIQQIKTDQEVDVYQAVREIQMCRPEFIQSENQYIFCYEAVLAYLNRTDTCLYANV